MGHQQRYITGGCGSPRKTVLFQIAVGGHEYLCLNAGEGEPVFMRQRISQKITHGSKSEFFIILLTDATFYDKLYPNEFKIERGRYWQE